MNNDIKLIINLEKGRRPDPIGTRKIQETVKPDGSKMRWWRKKTAKGWEYDGLVSDAEYKAQQSIERKKAKSKKLKEQTQKKVQQAKVDGKKQQSDGRPTDAEIAKMPTKQRMYWSDPDVTDARRELADLTGILTLDDNAEKYVKSKMGTVFRMSEDQKDIVDGVNLDFPSDIDGKAFDDPEFISDTLGGLKDLREQLLGKAGETDLKMDLMQEWSHFSSYDKRYYSDDFDAFYDAVKQTMKDRLDTSIDAFERHENDKILVGKIDSYDRGVRAVRITDKLEQVMIESIFGAIPNKDDLAWNSIPERYRDMLEAMGCDAPNWEARQWGHGELIGFATAAINDEFYNNVFKPWLELSNQYFVDSYEYQRRGYGNQVRYETYLYLQKASSSDDMVNVDSAKSGREEIQKEIGKKTVDFMNKTFRYQNCASRDSTQRTKDLDEISKQGQTHRDEIINEKQRQGGVLDSYFYARPVARRGIELLKLSDYIGSLGQWSQSSPFEFGLSKFGMTWRELANETKALSNRKGFDVNAYPEAIKAIADAGRAIGDRNRAGTKTKVASVLKGFRDSMSKTMQTVISVPDEDTIGMVSDVKPSSDSGWGGVDYSATLRHWGRYQAVDEHVAVGNTVKTSGIGMVHYKQVRKKRARKYMQRHGVDTQFVQNAYGGSSVGPKSALKAKWYDPEHGVATVPTDNRHNRRQYDTHVQASIALAIGSNWQLRKMTKTHDVLPDFKVSNEFKPFNQHNQLSRRWFLGVSNNPRQTNSDVRGMNNTLTPSIFNAGMESRYKESVAAILGISAQQIQAGGKAKPKIVLRTNKEGVDSWQKKINDEWTHDDPRLSPRNQWRKGSLKVQNVFDIMYHDYFDDYKKIEKDKGNVLYGWHGTSFVAGANIIKGGYTRGGGLFGEGQYLAQSSSKSAAYLAGGAGSFTRQPGFEGVLFWNRATLGKTGNPNQPHPQERDKSIDTVFAGGMTGGYSTGLMHNEWCVKNRKAVVPINWVDVVTQ